MVFVMDDNCTSKSELNFDESGVNSLNFFDIYGSESPNDKEGDPSNVEGNGRVSLDDNVNTVNKEDATIATQIDDTISSEGINQNVFNGEDHGEAPPSVRRSSRHRSQHVRFNDFVVGSNVKYGLEKYVSYYNLSRGFKKISWDRHEYANEWFQEGKPHLLKNIKSKSKLTISKSQKLQREISRLEAVSKELDNELYTFKECRKTVSNQKKKIVQAVARRSKR
ncbi:winged helix-turn-helix DNA-binding domain, Heat shock transcription factor family [Artemisia annua]|uniref:Winged helix-turn-helix DNA-binding domain, Heat shock transcription factor family n=1 Tax=Artemisia annua TaxID=35608 RepID=A0A2U1LBI8_ARTAN|nr:winged helix-turn-helix DNA-binding domain, Heat shock transcription factor family [Artemisia annua]